LVDQQNRKITIMATNQPLTVRTLALPTAITAAVIWAGFSIIGAAGAPSTPPTPAVVQEDDPGWDCHTMGNRICGTLQEDDPGWDCNVDGDRICGDPQGIHATDAWAAWDAGEGWRRLRAASTDTRVVYVGTATQSPNVDALTEVAVPSRDGWYVFRAATATTTLPTPINALD
jgi:hypothetical protein